MKGEGAIVFIIVFLLFLGVTLAYVDLPPGNAVSDSMGVDPTIEWNGFVVKTLLSSIFNGAIYGVIIWLVFTFGKRALRT